MTSEPPGSWIPPTNFEERLKALLVPPSLYIRYKAQKEWWRGEPEFRLLPFLVDRRRNAIDVGANKGTYTYALARLAKHVWAFEPNPKMFKILERGMAANVTAARMTEMKVSTRSAGYEYLSATSRMMFPASRQRSITFSISSNRSRKKITCFVL